MAETRAELPDKLYFKIGEVASIVGVKAYVLRYWESEFSFVRPAKTGSHHRLYRRRDVETLLAIKRLLYDERFTIAGARQRLKTLGKTTPHARNLTTGDPSYRSVLVLVKKEIESLHRLLS